MTDHLPVFGRNEPGDINMGTPAHSGMNQFFITLGFDNEASMESELAWIMKVAFSGL